MTSPLGNLARIKSVGRASSHQPGSSSSKSSTPVQLPLVAGHFSRYTAYTVTITPVTEKGKLAIDNTAPPLPMRPAAENEEYDGVTLLEQLGQGGFGRVYLGQWNGELCAVKILNRPYTQELPSSLGEDGGGGTASNVKDPVLEGMLSLGLKHPNLIQSYRYTVRTVQPGYAVQKAQAEAQAAVESPLAPPAGGTGRHTDMQGDADLPGHNIRKIFMSSTAGPAHVLSENGHGDPAGAPADAGAQQGGGRRSSGHLSTHRSVRSMTEQTRGGLGGPPGAARGVTPGKTGEEGSGAAPPNPMLQEVWIVSEFCDLGSLANAMDGGLLHGQDGHPRLHLVWGILSDVAAALLHLHGNNTIHGDLTAGNVLLLSRRAKVRRRLSTLDAWRGGIPLSSSLPQNRKFVAKVGDFGLARIVSPSGSFTDVSIHTRQIGTPAYMPPELLMDGVLKPQAE